MDIDDLAIRTVRLRKSLEFWRDLDLLELQLLALEPTCFEDYLDVRFSKSGQPKIEFYWLEFMLKVNIQTNNLGPIGRAAQFVRHHDKEKKAELSYAAIDH